MNQQMKKHRFLTIASLMIPLVAGMFFGSIRQSHAQTDQDWSEPVNLSNSGSSTDPALVIDARGLMRVIWVDEFDGYKYVESADGVTWTPPVTMQFPFSPKDDSRPILLADETGQIHILWRDRNNNLYYIRALPSGFNHPSTWTGRIKLANSVVGFDAVVGSRGVLHVGYVSSLGTASEPAGVYYRRLSGSGWSPAQRLYSSPYFRSLEPENTNVRLSVSNENVYIVWDDRPQKRIFLARSTNSGNRWEGVAQISGPEDSAGLELPYNINVNIVNGRALLIWQVGIPGSYCTLYSQWSLDDGNRFELPVKLTDGLASCPQRSDFIVQDEDISLALLNAQGDLFLIAWNGSAWSRLQAQNQLSTFINSATFDSVLLGCQKASVYKERLFVVGCDEGGGGDIWFRSRLLGSVEEWFPPPSAWTSSPVLEGVDQGISGLSSVADRENNVHVFWVQTPLSETAAGDPAVLYARWDGKWSEPRVILAGLKGIPSQLSATTDNQGRLLLSWTEGRNGDLYFSWADAKRANVPSEWAQPRQVPTPSQLSSSPDILVDDSGKIVIVYSVPLNEGRGIYIVQSNNLGKDWSHPISVMDAVAADWDSVDHPIVRLSRNGRLHVLFSRYSLREDSRSEGLYYSQSADGGMSWSQPHLVSERHVQWSRMVYLNNQSLHLVWQEKFGTGFAILHQISQDSGVTWGNSLTVSNLPDGFSQAALATDAEGRIHVVLTSIRDDNLVLQMLTWDGSQWSPQEGREVNIRENTPEYSTVAEVASQGALQVVVSLVYPDLVNDIRGEIIGISRSLGEFSGAPIPAPLLIATPSALTALPEMVGTVDIQMTPTGSSPLANVVDVPAPSRRNLFGWILVGVLTVLVIVFLLPGRRKRSG
jgi:hypothetical protein